MGFPPGGEGFSHAGAPLPDPCRGPRRRHNPRPATPGRIGSGMRPIGRVPSAGIAAGGFRKNFRFPDPSLPDCIRGRFGLGCRRKIPPATYSPMAQERMGSTSRSGSDPGQGLPAGRNLAGWSKVVPGNGSIRQGREEDPRTGTPEPPSAVARGRIGGSPARRFGPGMGALIPHQKFPESRRVRLPGIPGCPGNFPERVGEESAAGRDSGRGGTPAGSPHRRFPGKMPASP